MNLCKPALSELLYLLGFYSSCKAVVTGIYMKEPRSNLGDQ